MIYYFLHRYPNIVMVLGMCASFLTTFLGLRDHMDILPADEGRDFAVDGKLSRGKPRGAGIMFIIAFNVSALLFAPLYIGGKVKMEYIIYLGLVFIEMITGFLDDRATKPWGRLKKGLLDLLVSLVLAGTFVHYNGNTFHLTPTITYTVPVILLYLLIIAMAWISINVTNCADGVDGLSGTLTIVTLISFLLADIGYNYLTNFKYIIWFFIAALLAYLWFNAGPSVLMMGDAGSRAMGIFISIVALMSYNPVMYAVFALVLILDGGLGLFKVSIIKLTKNKNFMHKIRTPLHDHVRKNIATPWSNTQCVMKFTIIQLMISLVFIYLLIR